MEVNKENVIRDSTSCNFCKKGELSGKGGGLCASICEECLEELYKKGKNKFSNSL